MSLARKSVQQMLEMSMCRAKNMKIQHRWKCGEQKSRFGALALALLPLYAHIYTYTVFGNGCQMQFFMASKLLEIILFLFPFFMPGSEPVRATATPTPTANPNPTAVKSAEIHWNDNKTKTCLGRCYFVFVLAQF